MTGQREHQCSKTDRSQPCALARHHSRRMTRMRGLTLAEAMISLVLVSGVLASSLSAMGAAGTMRRSTEERHRARHLAQEMLSEVLDQAYEEPSPLMRTFGPEPLESLLFDRSLFDDVDDYDNTFTAPPRTRAGVLIPGYSDWVVMFDVAWVAPEALNTPVGSETHLKRIEVSVYKNSRKLVVLVGYCARAWKTPES